MYSVIFQYRRPVRLHCDLACMPLCHSVFLVFFVSAGFLHGCKRMMKMRLSPYLSIQHGSNSLTTIDHRTTRRKNGVRRRSAIRKLPAHNGRVALAEVGAQRRQPHDAGRAGAASVAPLQDRVHQQGMSQPPDTPTSGKGKEDVCGNNPYPSWLISHLARNSNRTTASSASRT